jgi:nucleoid-associated protein YgaU
MRGGRFVLALVAVLALSAGLASLLFAARMAAPSGETKRAGVVSVDPVRKRAEELAEAASQRFGEVLDQQKRLAQAPVQEPQPERGSPQIEPREARGRDPLVFLFLWLERSGRDYQMIMRRLAERGRGLPLRPPAKPEPGGPEKEKEVAKAAEQGRPAEEARRADEEAGKAEEARKAEQARQQAEAEEKRRAAEAKAEEERRQAEAASRAEEQQRLAEARAAEERRKAEEARRQEQARAEEEQRLAEARRAAEQPKAEEALRRAEEERRAEEKAAEEKRRADEARREVEAKVEAHRREVRPARQVELPKAGKRSAKKLARQRNKAVFRRLPGRRRSAARACAHAGQTVDVPGWYVVGAGDSLWAIADRHYGSGIRYRSIYRANRARISAAHRIYPCQRLLLPNG